MKPTKGIIWRMVSALNVDIANAINIFIYRFRPLFLSRGIVKTPLNDDNDMSDMEIIP